jgi:hypothetical protein
MVENNNAEIEKLARTLRASKLAVSESEAYRMATDMLSTSKKVHDDFKERDQKLYGEHKQSSEIETAHKMMEKITHNMGTGKSNVRIDIAQLDLGKPLKQLIEEQEEPIEKEDEDDAILLKDNNVLEQIAQSTPANVQTTIVEEVPEHFGRVQTNEPEKIEIHAEDEDLFDDDEDDKDSEEEHLAEKSVNNPEASESEEKEVSVKEVYF